MSGRLRILILVAIPAILVTAPASGQEGAAAVQKAFAAGDYAGALDLLGADRTAFRPGEEVLWRVRLAAGPEEALSLLSGSAQDDRLPPGVRVRLALESAAIEYGRGRYREAYAALEPFVREGDADVPGPAFIQAALALRALGDRRGARELLASVKPDDPSFAFARFYLGDIALDLQDPDLALRYLQAAEGAFGPAEQATVAGARFRALNAAGDTLAAARLRTEVAADHPGALANLEMGAPAVRPPAGLQAVPAPEDAPQAAASGKFCLQFGAFSDRSRALALAARLRAKVPEVRIDREPGPGGTALYKVRSGSFHNPALARTEAVRLGEATGQEALIAEVAAPGRMQD